MKKLVPASVVLLAGHLLLAGMANAQTPAASPSPTSVPASAATQKASDVLAHARQLYSEEGARVALPEFEKALALFRQEKDGKGEAITLGLIGNCYKKFGDHAKALEYLQQALAMKRKLGDRAEEGKTLSHLGLLHWEMGQYPQAIEHFSKAIAIGNQLSDRILEASSRNNLGLVYDEVGDYRRSLDEYNHALDLYRGTNFERGISDTIGNIGGTHLLLGEFNKALGYYQQALAIDEHANLKPGIALDLQNIALCYVGLGRLTKALETFDRSIKLANEAGLRKEEADSRKGKASALVQLGKYTAALKEYAEVLRVYEQAGLKQSQIEGLGDLGNLELRLGDVPSAEKDFRRALELSRAINHPRGTALIEYVLAQDNLVIFVLTSDGLHASTVAIRSADLEARVELLRDLMLRKNTNEWQLPSASLYKTLIAPIEAAGRLRDVNRLYIVPHATLHYVPFAALLRHPGNRSKVLIDDYTLAYLPAAATLVYRDDPRGTARSVLALAPANTRLRYARQESQDISNFFPRQHKVLLGSQATESSFKRLADQYDVIHLATHGYFNKFNPLLSGVMLEPDAQEDGRMEVHEILGLKLKAKLVTLSACDTALGSGYFAEVPAGDDLVGLTRAFLFAGTPSVLASLWELNDRSAGTLMHSFYGHLRQTDKATALALAQRSLRTRNGPYAHPYFWGSFILVGQMN
jgi:CHAT domain-containing protein